MWGGGGAWRVRTGGIAFVNARGEEESGVMVRRIIAFMNARGEDERGVMVRGILTVMS